MKFFRILKKIGDMQIGCGGTILLLFGGLMIFSAISPETTSTNRAEEREFQFRYQGKEAVTYRLKDPESARFRNLFSHVGKDGNRALCGEVNSRNSFGAYAGFMRFITYGTPGSTYLEEEFSHTFDDLWRDNCVLAPPKPARKPPQPEQAERKTPRQAAYAPARPGRATVVFICNNALAQAGQKSDLFNDRSKVLHLKDGAMLAIATWSGQQYKCTVDKQGNATISQ